MEKIKIFLYALGKTKLIISSLVSVALIGGGVALYQSNSSEDATQGSGESSENVDEVVLLSESTLSSLEIIPKESAFVMLFTPDEIREEMGVKNLLETEIGEKAKEFSEGMDNDLLKDLFDDPSSAGVNLSSEVLVFHSYENIEQHYGCLSVGIEDSKKFEEFIKQAFKTGGIEIKIRKKGNFKYFTGEEDDIEEGAAGIAWDDDRFIFIGGNANEDDLEGHMKKLMTLDEKDQITSHKNFGAFYKNRKDISIWMSTDLLDKFENEFAGDLEENLSQIPGMTISADEIIELADNNILTFQIDFGDGELICSSSFIPNRHLQKLIKTYNIFDIDFNKKTLKYIPKDNIAVLSQTINVDHVYDLIKQYADRSRITEFEDGMDKALGIDIDDVLNTFGGSFVANISSITTKRGEPFPLFSFVFDMRDSKLLDKMMRQFGSAAGIKKISGYYTLPLDDVDFFMDFNNNAFIVTNDKKSIRQFDKGGYSNHFSSNKITKNISYAYLNLDHNKYSDLIEESSGGSMPREAEMMMDIWKELFESVEFKQSIGKSSGTFSSEFKLSFKDKDQNILQTAYELVEKEEVQKLLYEMTAQSGSSADDDEYYDDEYYDDEYYDDEYYNDEYYDDEYYEEGEYYDEDEYYEDEYYRGVINDPDGYTNVREDKSSKSEIVFRVYEGEEFEIIDDRDDNWWLIEYNGDQGYIYRDRIDVIK